MITCNTNKICYFLTYPLPFSRSSNFCFFNWCLVFFFNWLCIVFIIITICVYMYVSVCACVCLCGCVCIQACVCVGQRLMSGVFLAHLWPNIYWSGVSHLTLISLIQLVFLVRLLSGSCLFLAYDCTQAIAPAQNFHGGRSSEIQVSHLCHKGFLYRLSPLSWHYLLFCKL